MKAAAFEGIERMVVREVEDPRLEPGGMIVKIEACAICGSDLKTLQQGNPRFEPPQIIGHELVGTIVEIGQGVEGFAVGERVTMATSISCGRCHFCHRGLGNICPNMVRISADFPGAFAEFMHIPPLAVQRGNVLKVPDSLSNEAGTIAEPLSCVINSQQIAGVGLGDTVVVIGAGPMGILQAETAKANGATRVIITQRSLPRLEMAKGFDVDAVIDAANEDVVARVLELTGGLGADVIMVAAPSKEAQEQALEMVKKNGVVNLFASLPKDDPYITLNSRLIHYGQVAVTGASDSAPQHVELALKMLAAEEIDTERLITHRVPLEDILDGFRAMKEKTSLKTLVYP
ncbi:MAG: alcohol dehydrogenase catalytic domain-containing protein [Anaerolineae bacterium]